MTTALFCHSMVGSILLVAALNLVRCRNVQPYGSATDIK